MLNITMDTQLAQLMDWLVERTAQQTAVKVLELLEARGIIPAQKETA